MDQSVPAVLGSTGVPRVAAPTHDAAWLHGAVAPHHAGIPAVPREAVRVDRALRRLAALRYQITLPLARAAAAIVRARAWTDLGYPNEHLFANELLDTTAKTLRNLAALDEPMNTYPELARAAAGTDGLHPIGRCAALVIAKVATPDTIEAWIERARRLSVRDLESLVRSTQETDDDGDACPRQPAAPLAHDGRGIASPGDAQAEQAGEMANDASTRGPEPDVLFRMQLPPEARMALDEVADLHRATSGHDATRTCFIEDLLAEVAATGVWAPDPERRSTGRFRPVRRGGGKSHTAPSRAAVRRNWDGLPTQTTEGRRATQLLEGFARDLRDLARITRQLPSVGKQVSCSAGSPASSHMPQRDADASEDAQRGHILQKRAVVRILRRLLAQENQIELRMGGLLLKQHERRAWSAFGCADLDEYAEQLGWTGDLARRRVDIARALRPLRSVRSAYEAGRVTLARTEWIIRKSRRVRLTEQSQKEWIAHAAELQTKRLRDESRILARQRLEQRASTARAVTLQQRTGGATGPKATENCFPVLPDDDTWLRSLSRVSGQARHRLLDLEGALLERALMRGAMLEERVVFSLPESLADDLHHCVTLLCRRLRKAAVAVRSPAEEARALLSVRIAATYVERGVHMPLWVGLLAVLEICVLEWDEPRRKGVIRSLQRRVLERDGYRCTAPGCTARRNLQVNHIHERSHGGPDAIWNLHTVCAVHHLQFIHAGRARVQGRAPGRLTWRIGRPEVAQWFVNERRIRSVI